MQQSTCLFTIYFLGRLLCKLGKRTQKDNVPVYVHEVQGNNLKKFSQGRCNEVWVDISGDIDKKFQISFLISTKLSPGE